MNQKNNNIPFDSWLIWVAVLIVIIIVGLSLYYSSDNSGKMESKRTSTPTSQVSTTTQTTKIIKLAVRKTRAIYQLNIQQRLWKKM